MVKPDSKVQAQSVKYTNVSHFKLSHLQLNESKTANKPKWPCYLNCSPAQINKSWPMKVKDIETLAHLKD